MTSTAEELHDGRYDGRYDFHGIIPSFSTFCTPVLIECHPINCPTEKGNAAEKSELQYKKEHEKRECSKLTDESARSIVEWCKKVSGEDAEDAVPSYATKTAEELAGEAVGPHPVGPLSSDNGLWKEHVSIPSEPHFGKDAQPNFPGVMYQKVLDVTQQYSIATVVAFLFIFRALRARLLSFASKH